MYIREREKIVIFDLSSLKMEYLNYWVYVVEYFLVEKIWVYLDFIWYYYIWLIKFCLDWWEIKDCRDVIEWWSIFEDVWSEIN